MRREVTETWEGEKDWGSRRVDVVVTDSRDEATSLTPGTKSVPDGPLMYLRVNDAVVGLSEDKTVAGLIRALREAHRSYRRRLARAKKDAEEPSPGVPPG